MKRFKTVDEYIENAPENMKGKLKELRAIIIEAAPKAEEKISYSMPYYGYEGRLAYFAYAKNHIGFYVMPPVIEEFKDKLKKYGTAKATIRFTMAEKLPVSLIQELIKAGIKNNEAKKK